MAQAIVYCDRCGRMIPPGDVAAGKYHETTGGAMCPDCYSSLSPQDRARLGPAGTKTASRASVERVGPKASAHAAEPPSRRRVAMVVLVSVLVGIPIGVVVVLALSAGADQPADVPRVPRMAAPVAPSPGPPPTRAPVVVASHDAHDGEAPATTKSPDAPRPEDAIRRLAKIREKITPDFRRHDDVVRELTYFASDFKGTPQVAQAKALLEKVNREHAAFCEQALAEARSTADDLVDKKRYDVALSTLRALDARFTGSAWYADGGREKIAAAVAAVENVRPAPPSQAPRVATVTSATTPAPTAAISEDDLVPGLMGQYYKGRREDRKLVMRRIDTKMRHEWGHRAPSAAVGSDNYEVTWTGYFKAPADGTYRFRMYAEDGGHIGLDGHRLRHGKAYEVHLSAGLHPMEAYFDQQAGMGWCTVTVAGPDFPERILGAEFLRTPPGDEDAAAAEASLADTGKPTPVTGLAPGVWVEGEGGFGDGGVEELKDASGERALGFYNYKERLRHVPIDVPVDLADAWLYVRYSTRNARDAIEMDVLLDRPGGERKLGRLAMHASTDLTWAKLAVGRIPAGTRALRLVAPGPRGFVAFDVIGLVPGEFTEAWTPPNKLSGTELFPSGPVLDVADTAEKRRLLLLESTGDPERDGYLLDVSIINNLLRMREGRTVRPRVIGTVGGRLALGSSFSALLRRKELSASGGYRFDKAVAIATTDIGAAALSGALEKKLARGGVELVRICFDASNLAENLTTVSAAQALGGLVSIALKAGVVPVLYTAPSYTGAGAPRVAAITNYNQAIVKTARGTGVPYVDATRILNEKGSAKELFDRNGRPKSAGLDAVNERFLELYLVLDRWVFAREGK